MIDSVEDIAMQLSILLIKQISQLFLMIFMGYLMVKINFLKEEDSKVLSKIILYLVIPCVIVSAFQVEHTKSMIKGLEAALIASVILQILLLLITCLLKKLLRLDSVEVTSVYYSNTGNLIVPLVTYILGDEWVVYGCVFMSVQLIFIWTHCTNTISRETGFDFKKIFLNINMISVIVGTFLFVTHIRLPEILQSTMESVGSMIGPLSMIVTGMIMAGVSFKEVFTNKRIYLISFLRLIVLPMISLAVIRAGNMVSWHEDGGKILLIIYLAIITPCASTVTQMCQVYGNNARYASAINVMTTLLAILTMPLFVLLFQMTIF